MPELAEVELARRQWEPAHGQRILEIHSHPRAGIFRKCPAETLAILRDRTLHTSRTHGKRLLFSFHDQSHDPIHLELHLGMSGRLVLASPDHQAEKHDHLILKSSQFSLVFNDYRTFGNVLLHEQSDPWRELPPQPHDRVFTEPYLERHLLRYPQRPLKALLLDQSLFPGIGNWMADEICWRLRVHPAIPSQQVGAAALRKVVRFVIFGALRHVADRNPASNAHGFAPGSYVANVPPKNWLFQHRWKKGGHCPSCNHSLARDTIATRTTAWCPHCQPA